MLVAIEGIDGSGKGTQTKLVHALAVAAGLSVASISFPQYGRNPFAEAVSDYLNGRFGGLDDVHPKLAALLFAGDRFASRSLLAETLASNDLVLCDRYVASNMAHQAAKLASDERASFIEWVMSIEFGAYELPRPALSIYLEIPVEAARELVSKKPARDNFGTFSETGQGGYTSLKADIHEEDADYLSNCREVYEYLVAGDVAGPWATMHCLDSSGRLRAPEELASEIWSRVRDRIENRG